MNVTISSDYRFCATPDGAVWTDGPCHYRFLSRYLAAFDRVNVIARVAPVMRAPENCQAASGPGVGFSAIPSYLGPWQYLRRRGEIARAVRAAIGPRDAVILNVPGQVANCVAAALSRGRPYAVQVLGDPYQMLAPGVIRVPLRPLFRQWYYRYMQRLVRRARAALYVTRRSLQSRYPCPNYMLGLSDVDLPPEALSREPHQQLPASGAVTLVTVGAMTQLQKGYDLLIEAAAQCVRAGVDLRVVLVGDGKHRPELESLANHLGIANRVVFRGQLPAGELIRAELDAADLFVFPSRSEGLPRALLEAMARGLPCIASRIGGIPELLDDEDLVPPGNAARLAEAIGKVLSDPRRYARMAARNLLVANDYRAEALDHHRNEFYRYVASLTEQWLNADHCGGVDSHVRSSTPVAIPEEATS